MYELMKKLMVEVKAVDSLLTTLNAELKATRGVEDLGHTKLLVSLACEKQLALKHWLAEVAADVETKFANTVW